MGEGGFRGPRAAVWELFSPVKWPLASQDGHLEVLSLGDGLWPRPPEQRPLQGLWRSREPPGRAVRADGGEGEGAKELKR